MTRAEIRRTSFFVVAYYTICLTTKLLKFWKYQTNVSGYPPMRWNYHNRSSPSISLEPDRRVCAPRTEVPHPGAKKQSREGRFQRLTNYVFRFLTLAATCH